MKAETCFIAPGDAEVNKGFKAEVFPEGYSEVKEGNIFPIAPLPHTVFILIHGQPKLVVTYSW